MANGSPPPASTLGYYKERMLLVLGHIQDNLDSALRLEDLARRGGLSPYHFHRVFRGLMGEPLMTHVRRLRLERAALRLRGTRQPIVAIAMDAGYDSHEAFTRAFRQAFGCSPSEHRRGGGSHQLPSRSGVHYSPDRPFTFRTPSPPRNSSRVTVESLEPQRVAYIRHLGPYNECGPAWDRLCTWMGKEGYLGSGCRMLGLSHDDPASTAPEKIRYDACITVDDAFQPTPQIRVKTVAGGTYARVTHFGPYAHLDRSYAALFGRWLPRSGRLVRNEPCFEVYLTDPGNTAPADLVTDIYLPLD